MLLPAPKGISPRPSSALQDYGEALNAIQAAATKVGSIDSEAKRISRTERILRLAERLNSTRSDVWLQSKTDFGVHDPTKKGLGTVFQSRDTELAALLHELARAGDDAARARALAGISKFFDKYPRDRRKALIDPHRLPWQSPPAKVRKPITTDHDFINLFANRTAPAFATQKEARRKSAPAVAGPDDLAESSDVQLTPQIRQQASQLGNSPLAIYNWVRNNVDFVPTYGSIQGSEATFEKLRGNSFDTASLLIALLRSSNIPARYRYGTVEVPIDQAENWLGGLTNAQAALDLLAQGGIPSAPVIAGGAVVAIQFEHVWVEAKLPFFPSRGATSGGIATWVPLDASFKLYDMSAGIDLQDQVPFDGAAALSAVGSGVTANSAEGSVSGISFELAQSQLNSYLAQVKSYVASSTQNSSPGSIFGNRQIRPVNATTLPGTLSLKRVASAGEFAQIPAALRHQFQFSIYASPEDRDSDSPLVAFRSDLPSLAGKRVGIWFIPATAADASAFASLVPPPDATGQISTAQLPSAIPSTINVVPQIRVDGVVLSTGPAVPIGTELPSRGGFTTHDLSGWDLTNDDSIVGGQASALGLSIQGLSQAQLSALQSDMQAMSDRVDVGNYAGVTDEQLVGNSLQAVIWSYFANAESAARVSSITSNVVNLEWLSYGLFHARLEPTKLFGVVITGAQFAGGLLDVGHLSWLRVSKSNNAREFAAYGAFHAVQASAFEHSVLESLIRTDACRFMFDAPSSLPLCPDEAVSAAKALTIAAIQGQKIYQITASNVSALQSIDLSDQAKEDIRNAALAGKVATVHANRITVGRWTGSGYAIADPQTGAGAYIIEGGANGAALDDDALKGLEALADLVVAPAYASGPDTDKKDHDDHMSLFLEKLSEFLEHVLKDPILKAALKTISKAFGLLDAVKIWNTCSGSDAAAELTWWAIMMVIQAALVAGAGALGGFYAAFIVSALYDYYVMEPSTHDSLTICKMSGAGG
jgi:transglutaminase-like putative cysteine protease